ncbi:TetR family transcriptional regulator C-terminal domain-containing protein, partial [Salmonella enterica]
YLVINAQWQGMLAEVIERGVAEGIFRCDSPQRAARQIFALAMGYADDLMLKPSVESAEAVLDEVMEVAQLLLGFSA